MGGVMSNDYKKGIKDCLKIIYDLKDKHNLSKNNEVPINYGTLCGIIIKMEELLERQQKNLLKSLKKILARIRII